MLQLRDWCARSTGHLAGTPPHPSRRRLALTARAQRAHCGKHSGRVGERLLWAAHPCSACCVTRGPSSEWVAAKARARTHTLARSPPAPPRAHAPAGLGAPPPSGPLYRLAHRLLLLLLPRTSTLHGRATDCIALCANPEARDPGAPPSGSVLCTQHREVELTSHGSRAHTHSRPMRRHSSPHVDSRPPPSPHLNYASPRFPRHPETLLHLAGHGRALIVAPALAVPTLGCRCSRAAAPLGAPAPSQAAAKHGQEAAGGGTRRSARRRHRRWREGGRRRRQQRQQQEEQQEQQLRHRTRAATMTTPW